MLTENGIVNFMAERSDPSKFPGDEIIPREVDGQEVLSQHPGRDIIDIEEGVLDSLRRNVQEAFRCQQANHALEQEDIPR